MKSRIITVLGIAVLTPVFLIGTVLAVEDPGQTTTTNTTTSETKPESTTTTTPKTLSAEEKQKLAERLQKRKEELKTKLTTVQQKRLQTRCKASQGLIQKVSGRQNGLETSRTKVHANLVDRLTKLETKLADKNLDTTELKAQITELQAKIATFKTDLEAYKTAVADLGQMDCEADPTAFKASLDSSRTALQKVHDDAAAIRAYVKDTIKPTLQKIRAQLGDQNQEGSTTTKPEDNVTQPEGN